MSVILKHGDSREVLKAMPDACFHAVVCDPPYSLVSIQKRFGKPGSAAAKGGVYNRAARGFMGKQWDTGETAFDPAFWAEVYRVLKPGGHLIAFGGTRTYHRLACALEDAGFEVRDMLAWMFGSGFPKSHNVAKGIDKAAGAVREVIGQARTMKGDSGAQTYAALGEFKQSKFVDITAPATDAARAWEGWGTALKPAHEPICLARKPLSEGTVAGNVLAHKTGALNINGCRVPTDEDLNGGAYAETGNRGVSQSLHGGSGMNVAGKTVGKPFVQPLGRWPANVVTDGSEEVIAAFPDTGAGGFPASRGRGGIGSNGHGGQDGLDARTTDSGSAARFFYSAKADAGDRLQSKHPTVKPVDLMRWLVRLVTPKGGHVLDPFAGSGTTGMACMAEGFDCTLIEREAEYVADIRRRIAHVSGHDTPLFAEATP